MSSHKTTPHLKTTHGSYFIGPIEEISTSESERDDEIGSDLSVHFTVVDAPRDHDAKIHSLKAVNACVASHVHMPKGTSEGLCKKGRICDA